MELRDRSQGLDLRKTLVSHVGVRVACVSNQLSLLRWFCFCAGFESAFTLFVYLHVF